MYLFYVFLYHFQSSGGIIILAEPLVKPKGVTYANEYAGTFDLRTGTVLQRTVNLTSEHLESLWENIR